MPWIRMIQEGDADEALAGLNRIADGLGVELEEGS